MAGGGIGPACRNRDLRIAVKRARVSMYSPIAESSGVGPAATSFRRSLTMRSTMATDSVRRVVSSGLGMELWSAAVWDVGCADQEIGVPRWGGMPPDRKNDNRGCSKKGIPLETLRKQRDP